jgi:hypothetical protein
VSYVPPTGGAEKFLRPINLPAPPPLASRCCSGPPWAGLLPASAGNSVGESPSGPERPGPTVSRLDYIWKYKIMYVSIFLLLEKKENPRVLIFVLKCIKKINKLAIASTQLICWRESHFPAQYARLLCVCVCVCVCGFHPRTYMP